MTYFLSIIIGIMSSLAASLLFLLFLSRLKPRIVISSQIAKEKISENKIVYKIKVINKGVRSIINIKARLHLMILKVVSGGVMVRSIEIPLIRTDPLEIPGFDPKDVQASYAFRFRTYEDLDAIWNDDSTSYLRFRILAMDSLSGFGKVFKQD
jgi:hypothetical protein